MNWWAIPPCPFWLALEHDPEKRTPVLGKDQAPKGARVGEICADVATGTAESKRIVSLRQRRRFRPRGKTPERLIANRVPTYSDS
jgi:hypothetical protein